MNKRKTLLILLITSITLVPLSIFIYSNLTEDEQSSTTFDDCKTWFDGCNTCTLDEHGGAMCTERYCDLEDYEEPKCLD